MLQLLNITKEYGTANNKVYALKNVNIAFDENEFVSIIGPSGCGKTTLLNIIGGLDQYSTGDLQVNGKSTTSFHPSDWDAYRNSTIGFVFQSYNLIPHLNVLDNVAIALSLAGVSTNERHDRAKKILKEVGLADQLYKKPNQLSGGQMQRVAIARALVNNPKILLADEPTGALDSKTSIQILELIKKISHGRLVIMVTHNSDLAEKYSDRIVQLLDGSVVQDSKKIFVKEPTDYQEKMKVKSTSMPYGTALKTSFKNLLTKRARTLITAFAGSIGIIGISLVLAISNGMNLYTTKMQSDTLSGFPLTISQNVVTTNRMMNAPTTTNDNEFPNDNILHAYDETSDIVSHVNVIDQSYLDYLSNLNPAWYNSISYSRAVSIHLLSKTSSNNYIQVATTTGSGLSILGNTRVFNEIPDNRSFIESQYDLLGQESHYPENYNEVVLIVDKQNRIDITILNAFGLDVNDNYQISDFIGQEFKVIENDDYYHQIGGIFVPRNDYETMYEASSSTLQIVGVMRVKAEAPSELLTAGIGYTTALTTHVLDTAGASQIVLAQKDNHTTNLLTGQNFNSQVTYKSIMKIIGGDSIPTGIQIYPTSFETKELIKDYLDMYNDDRVIEDKIIYSDLAETISSVISTLISTITLILTAFAAISLVVSSIMIGIITYVSVVERTREIGIMRAIGARKKDIARIFNAESTIIGLTAGVLGVVIAVLLSIPISLLISQFVDTSFLVSLPIEKAIILIVLSVVLTFIAGLIPSSIAAKRNPVVALRTE